MNTFSLSTSWNSRAHSNGLDLIEEIKRMGFDTVELNFALTDGMVNDILRLKEDGGIKVSSLHNMCPLPKEIPLNKASPDYYSLSSGDEAERTLALNAAKITIDYAKRFNARAVVLHAGRIPIKDRTRDLASLFDDRQNFIKLREDMIRERSEKGGAYLDNIMKSLEELTTYARSGGIALGIENRCYYSEIPIMKEFEMIFSHFKDGDLYYWHDVGHAEVFDRLGLVRHPDLLDKFSNRLIGIHLHDIMGLVDDHKSPGMGTFDFKMLKPYVNNDIIKVLEIHQPSGAEQVRRSVEFLSKLLG